jgi:glycosyltransferase involved in cell wall biosynthesis
MGLPVGGVRTDGIGADPPLGAAPRLRAQVTPAAPTVAINARAAVRSHIGGVERLAREMARHLPALAPQRYRVIRPPARLAHRLGHVWEQAVLPFQAAGARLLYSPANLAPVLSDRNVVVIHDVAALRHPEAYSRQYVAYQRALLPALARRARLLITVSEFSRRELIDVLGAPADRVRVIPEGVDERFAGPADPEPVRAHYDLTRPYVLVVATESRRKNLPVLAAAARALAERGVELVLVGSGRPYLRTGEVPLRRLGYVPDQELPGLYAGALALALPSRYEGFGLPCLEAMACGTPVVAADAGALPETVAQAGLLVAPDDAEGFVQALLCLIAEDGPRAELIGAGRARAAAFTWSRAAALTDAAIGELLAEP